MTIRPGPRNLITDVEGILVGNAEDHRVRTGVTVIYPEARCAAAADVRGGAPGTWNVQALDATSLANEVDAIVLSGGSMYGLDAGGGVVAALGARGRGIGFGGAVIPVVPGAILFDLANGGEKDWGEAPPYAALGRAALDAVGPDFALGNAGAGLGARSGALKGGLGSASTVTEDGLQIGALVAVNSFGSAVMPGCDRFWAGPLELGGEFGGLGPPPAGWRGEAEMPLPPSFAANPMANTTIAVVACNVALGKGELQRLAIMAQDGLARAIRPIHTPFDGDSVFTMATGRLPLTNPAMLARLGHLAADTLARAVARGVYHAESLGDRPGGGGSNDMGEAITAPQTGTSDKVDPAALAASVVAVTVSIFVVPGPFEVFNLVVATVVLSILIAFYGDKARSPAESWAFACGAALVAMPAFGFALEAARTDLPLDFLVNGNLWNCGPAPCQGESRVSSVPTTGLAIVWLGLAITFTGIDLRHQATRSRRG